MSRALEKATPEHAGPLRAAASELRALGLLAPRGPAGLSLRVDGERFVFTTGARADGDVRMVQIDGQSDGQANASAAGFHAALFGHRRDVQAIVHCTPVHVTALALRGVTVAQCVCSDAIAPLGDESIEADRRGGDLAGAVVDAAVGVDLVSLGRLGLVSLATSLARAIDRVQAAEHAARITHAVGQQGGVSFGSQQGVAAIRAAAGEHGWTDNASGCERCNACELGQLRGVGRQPNAAVEEALDSFLRR